MFEQVISSALYVREPKCTDHTEWGVGSDITAKGLLPCKLWLKHIKNTGRGRFIIDKNKEFRVYNQQSLN